MREIIFIKINKNRSTPKNNKKITYNNKNMRNLRPNKKKNKIPIQKNRRFKLHKINNNNNEDFIV